MPRVSEQNCCCHHNLQGQKPQNSYHPIHISSGEGISGPQPVRKIEMGSTVEEIFFTTRQILYPNYLEESRIGRQLGVLPAHTWHARLNHMSFLVKHSRSKLTGSLHYQGQRFRQPQGRKISVEV